ASGNYSLALKATGTVVGWGGDFDGQSSPPEGLTDVVAITAGLFHGLALRSDGTVVGWGSNESGQTSPPEGLTDVVAITAGGYHSLALASDGTLVSWGDNYEGQSSPPEGLTDVVAIAAGWVHSLALKADGTVVGWGNNMYGQVSPPADLTDVVAIAAGIFHSLALKADGTVVGWGWNDYLQATPPDGLTDVLAIAAGGYRGLALKDDGTVVGWGDYSAPVPPPEELNNVVAIAAGWYHSLALLAPNEPPISNPNGPYLGAIGMEINFDGAASSDPDGDPLSYDWNWGDDTTSPDAGSTPTHAYTAAGIYDVCLNVTDPSGAADNACTSAVVYNPEGGFVSGDGWIDSPAGAYAPDPALTGKATFSFVSKYKKGANVPTGNLEFKVQAADLNFRADSYEWLVITGSDYGMFKGVGSINGMGEYKFKVWTGENEADTFRIKIWTEDEFGIETVIYDNGMDQAMSGGSIELHTGGK
ncbi:MAG: PKD domain-containing protein, partial [Syntrophales bacterium]|nr:PKD domain-containing protein [Syntrophales bacterium]